MITDHEKFEIDFTFPDDFLVYLRGIQRGAKSSNRMPVLICKDSKKKLIGVVTFTAELRRFETELIKAKSELFNIKSLNRGNYGE